VAAVATAAEEAAAEAQVVLVGELVRELQAVHSQSVPGTLPSFRTRRGGHARWESQQDTRISERTPRCR